MGKLTYVEVLHFMYPKVMAAKLHNDAININSQDLPMVNMPTLRMNRQQTLPNFWFFHRS